LSRRDCSYRRLKTLSLSRNGKTVTSKGGRDKGHRRELELTIEAMKRSNSAPIPFLELVEVTEATFAVEEAIRSRKTVNLDAGTGYRSIDDHQRNSAPRS
jgi:hypothetical protein